MESKEWISLGDEFTTEELEIFKKIPEAAFSDLKYRIFKINCMKENELVEKLKCFYLNTEGDEEFLRKKLKDCYKKIILSSIDFSLSPQLLSHYVIIDFEATCEEINPPDYRHEIIEFPAVLVNSKNQEVVDCFQMYCKPQINPTISKFCTELTGITQDQVNSAETFDKVLLHFQNWLVKHNLGRGHKFGIVTDGPWDMSRFLYSQCNYSNVNFPKWASKWVNLRRSFSKFYQCERFSLKNMLEYLELDFEGRPHCGLDDSKNIARILLRMIYDGANIQINERITCSKKPKESGCHSKEPKEDDINEISKKIKKLRIEAHYATVYYTDKMPLYKLSRRERLIAETQLARKILNSENQGSLGLGRKTRRRKRAKKDC